MSLLSTLFFFFSTAVLAAPTPTTAESPQTTNRQPLTNLSHSSSPQKPVQTSASLQARLQALTEKNPRKSSDLVVFDLPVTYNKKVSKWIQYYQTRGSKWFREWLERSTKYMPFLQEELKKSGLPTDLAFMVMIESGFSFSATSGADAVGPWQFIEPTGFRYGLKKNWWLDERRDLQKSTRAAIRYLRDLYSEFGSWELVAASYNMGEAGLRNRIQKYRSKDFWALIRMGALPAETTEYVPKILAAMLISKAPNLYGFRGVERLDAYEYETIAAPGGTDINKIADTLGVTRKSMKDLNAELLLGYIPRQVERHSIRVPKGAGRIVAESFRSKNQSIQ